ncbi:MAG: cadherin-like domain-containing protein, partial [Bacteroidota bacterium]
FGAPIEVTSSLVVGGPGQITDLNVIGLQGLHEAVSELTVSLISPNNTEVKLFSNQCQEIHQDFVLNFDEEAQTSIFDCPPVQGATYQPLESLSAFYGESAAGIWTLKVVDSANFSGGELQGWGLQICTNVGTVFPELITNETLTVRQWSSDTISTTLLEATDGVSAANELVYTLVNEPQRGAVILNGIVLEAGDFFSQNDLNLDRLVYQHNGSFSPVDSFRFDVRNQLGGWVGIFAFQIDVTSASSRDAILADIGLSLFPNPAQEQVEVQVNGLSGQTVQMQLLNLQGQHIRQQQFGRVADRAQATIPVRQLAAGMYLLQVEVDGQSLYRKLMVE